MSINYTFSSGEAIAAFIKAMGFPDSSIVGDFTLSCPVGGIVTGIFNLFIPEDQFKKLCELAPELRRNALLKVTTIGDDGDVKRLEIDGQNQSLMDEVTRLREINKVLRKQLEDK